MYIKQEIKDIEVSYIRKLAMKMKEYKDGINLTIGEPADDVPVEIKEYMIEKVKEHVGYGMPGGLIELRKAYTDFYNKQFGANYTYEECYVNSGSTESFSTFFSAVLEPGDEVILPLPTYPGYAPNIIFDKAVPVFIDNKENNYEITAKLLEKYITPKTKIIVLTYPNNPLGSIMPLEEMDKIAKLIEKHNIYLLSDEIYATLSFEKYNSFARYHHLKDKIVVINGMSKSHSMTGYRIGFTMASASLIKELIKMSQYRMTCPNVVAQHGSLKALELYPTRENIVKAYQEKINYLITELTRLGFKCYEPKGAFYIYADYTNLFDMDSFTLANDLIEKVKVGIVPSIAFRVEGAVRISVNKDMNQLKEFIRRLEKYINEYKGK